MLNLEINLRNATAPAAQARQFIKVAPDLELPGFTMKFDRDEEVYGEGEPADFVYRVVSGVVRSYHVLDDGRRQISGFHFAGDLFGLEVGSEHMASAEAVCPSEIGLVKRKTLDRSTADNPAVARELWAVTSEELKRAQAHLLLLGRKTALERVASFLIDMANRSDDDDAVKIPMSRNDIADYLGLTIETVSRTLTQLERKGAIKLPSCRHIVLCDRKALMRADA